MADHPTDRPGAPPAGVRTTRRRGRASAAKTAALADLLPRWSWRPAGTDTAELLLDIGVGTGTATRAWATANPEVTVLAVELHRPGLARLVTDLEADGPPNVRVAEADALALLDSFEPGSLAGIRVLFPDPWPKRRHVRRRLVDLAFVHRGADVIRPGGTLHLATDWSDYADQMRAVIACERRFDPLIDGTDVEEPGSWHTTRPDRPVTVYEQRGLDAGRPITDLIAVRRTDPT